MKRINIIIVLVALLIMVGCDKVVYLPQVTSDVKVNGTSVDFLVDFDRGDEGYMPKVEYDTDINFSSSKTVFLELQPKDNHYRVAFEGLQPNTTYYYRFIASNSADGSILVNNGESFTTKEVTPPTIGQLPGRFSVSESKKVCFSKGNLQYRASINLWRFADNQYDCIGKGNEYISEDYDGLIDLFGWGTSGYSWGSQCYQPWSTNSYGTNYYSSLLGFADLSGQSDWGYNAICNGGYLTDSWRTLLKDEWMYLFLHRNTPSGVRFAKAILNKVKGLLLLPDNWDAEAFPLNDTNNAESTFSSNKISLSKWTEMEAAGAVFLPTAGGRDERTLVDYGQVCYYWSASFYSIEGLFGAGNAYAVAADDEAFISDYTVPKCYGLSVRLVRTINE